MKVATKADDVPWRVRMERLVERLARNCGSCPYKGGSRCSECDCATAAGIVRDRDSEAANPHPSEKIKPDSRRIKVAGNMAGRGWLKPADILWPCETPANVRTMDLEFLVTAGIVERRQPDPSNARVFLYRRVEK